MANIFQLVHDWLRNESNGKWLLILDNADDARWLLKPYTTSGAAPASGSHNGSTRSLWEYLPESQNGSVLVTTRSRSVALKLVEERDIIAVEPMDEAHAVALFERKLLVESDREDTIELVAALEFIPLAIVQAAAYINQTTPRCSVRKYIDMFQKTDRSKTRLLTYEAGQLRRDRKAKNSTIVTWQGVFNYICREQLSAANPLSLMRIFNRQETGKRVLGQGHLERLKELEDLEGYLIEARKKLLGEDPPGTLTSMADLAFTWKGEGRQVKAIAFLDHCLQRQQRILGANHPDTVFTRSTLEKWKKMSDRFQISETDDSDIAPSDVGNTDSFMEELSMDHVEADRMTVSSSWLWLMSIYSPPPAGYQRISYICVSPLLLLTSHNRFNGFLGLWRTFLSRC
jgi:Tetratricopeptide repeat